MSPLVAAPYKRKEGWKAEDVLPLADKGPDGKQRVLRISTYRHRRIATLKADDMEQNGKDRATVPLNDRAMQALREAHEGRTSEYVIEYRGGPVADIKRGIEAASTRTGIKCHPHMFRHSAAVWMAEDRTPMEEIASFLGHRDTRLR